MPFVAHPFCDRGPQDAPLEREHSRGKKVAWIGGGRKGWGFCEATRGSEMCLYFLSKRTFTWYRTEPATSYQTE